MVALHWWDTSIIAIAVEQAIIAAVSAVLHVAERERTFWCAALLLSAIVTCLGHSKNVTNVSREAGVAVHPPTAESQVPGPVQHGKCQQHEATGLTERILD